MKPEVPSTDSCTDPAVSVEPATAGGADAPDKPALRATPLIALQASLQRAGFPAFRAKQIFQWVFKHDARSIDEMKNVPKDVRTFLEENYRWGGIEGVEAERRAGDGTAKLLFRLADGATIESVLMRNEDHYTLCVSSQVGCPLQCSFCLTGLVGLKRNLTTDEIVDQVLYARRYLAAHSAPDTPPLRNLVFMGMGEPMLNLDNVVAAVRLLTQPDGAGFSPRRITVSTVGLVPGIERLGQADTGVRLAISLNATTNEFRQTIMPITKKYSIETLLDACRAFPLTNRSRITFEYVMMDGLNDSLADAARLVSMLHGIQCKVNLIPFNEHSSLPYRRPSEERIAAFRDHLVSKYYTATIRYSKGPEIEAACGQLFAGEKLAAKAAKAAAKRATAKRTRGA